MANFVATSAVDMGTIAISAFASGTVATQSPTVHRVTVGADFDELTGTGFTYNVSGRLTGGTINSWVHNVGGTTQFTISGLSYSGATFATFLPSNPQGLLASIFANNDSLTGSSGNDYLLGYAGIDTVNGGNGDDTLDGGTGGDKLAGGLGNDTYIVDDATDTVTDAAAQGTDTVKSSVTFTLGANTENLTLTGSAAINGTGSIINNNIIGNTGNNSLVGDAGNDSIVGGGGTDTIDGGAGNDTLSGVGSTATLTGGTGNDYFIIDAGDVVSELAAGGTDTVESSADHTLGADFENLTLTGTAINGTGNALANIIVGNGSNNVLTALGGNDQVSGGGGADTIDGGDGNDTIDGGFGIDKMTGGLGNDYFYVDNGGDVVVEAAAGGTDTVESSATYTMAAEVENLVITSWATANGTGNVLANTITGSDYVNVLSGGGANDTIDGGFGNDTINGDDGDDSLTGGADNDSLNGGVGADRMLGGLGDDTYVVDDAGDIVTEAAAQGTADTVQAGLTYTLGANVENLLLTGAAVNGTGNTLDNKITGNIGNNSLNGSSGDDYLNGNGGADTMVGGAGDDTFITDDGTDVITEAAAGGIDTVQSGGSFTLMGTQLENLTLTGGSALNGTGNAFNNVILGNSGNNSLVGDVGNDSLVGGGGTDNIDGGAGNDTLDGVGSLATLIGGVGNDFYFVDGNDTIVEAAGEGTDTVNSYVNHTLVAEFENLMLLGSAVTGVGNDVNNDITGNVNGNNLSGGLGNDTIDGGLGDDVLSGEVGVDSLIGGDGNDSLDGGDGADRMAGGVGNDTYVISVASDVITEAVGTAGGWDTVQSSVAYNLASNVEELWLLGSANINANGNTVANVIHGNAGDNSLNGGAGNDTLFGGAGNDTLFGSTGNDTYEISDTTDKITEVKGQGVDTVVTYIDYSMGSNNALENLVLLGAAKDGTGNLANNVITGNANNNTIDSSAGNDTIYGGDGNDTLNGSLGNDRVYGDAGADRISTLYGQDRVRYRDVLDAGDTLNSFSTSGSSQDYIDLDALFDSLGATTAERAARVSIVDNGGGVNVMIDADNNGSAELMLCSITAAVTSAISVGNATTNDVFLGTL